ncbi:hypothetical protein GJ496_005873 [Pomphorhynchus laevis]|nr:hypothetical protein GJ496_005873 [Pomphorhynchus laevis]
MFYFKWIFRGLSHLARNSWIFLKFLLVYPLILLILLYISSLIIFLSNRLKFIFKDADAYAVYLTSLIWTLVAIVYNGHSIVGLENLPVNGPGLIIFYHGQLPLDIIYAISRVYLVKKRLIALVADRFFTALPGFHTFKSVLNVSNGDVNSCTECLLNGNLLAISPGGVREAQFASCTDYNIIWANRLGYAKVAVNSDCPVYLMFTTNSRQVTYCFPFAHNLFGWLYERTRLPLRPIFGIFPVKMTTYISEPIYTCGLSASEFDDKVRFRMQQMIEAHQKLPASIISALLDRLPFWIMSHSQSKSHGQ